MDKQTNFDKVYSLIEQYGNLDDRERLIFDVKIHLSQKSRDLDIDISKVKTAISLLENLEYPDEKFEETLKWINESAVKIFGK